MKSVLVANRGEIAVRVIRSAQEMGLRTIAIYSELDRDALHVQLADEAWNVGPAPAAESYLNMERILEVAREAQAEAVHPGYGFLAENADFAEAVSEAGLIWIGPPPEAIRIMGDKISSRQAAQAAGVPMVPGTVEALESADEARRVAADFGYPVAIKATAGGGGKGLRVVWNESELEAAIDGAQREAEAYFGNAAVYVEKYVERARHIEAQVIVDADGAGHFLGERDCSVQRRHQKLIEETPAVGFPDRVRKKFGKAAVAIAEACNYRNAGTVEFLVDPDFNFYFLEMNTRLQVEHTITEMVTGIDLVQAQLAVAQGDPLPFKAVESNGHAIEFRINAEDPGRGFLPTPGRVIEYREPAGFGVRVDSWIQPSTTVSQYYDNLMAKLVVWGADRDEAIRRGKRALEEYVISGVRSTIPAHLAVLAHDDFLAGRHHTKWMEDEMDLSNITWETSSTLPEETDLTERSIMVEVGGRRYDIRMWTSQIQPAAGGTRAAPRRKSPTLGRGGGGTGEADAGVLTAPMQGTIVKLHVKAGDHVEAGDPVCILEAMKMENEVKAPIAGEVVDMKVRAGDTVTP
ncbi:MAG: acetyl-CoA carboxylase biotin carboxylase subunit, partial [Acidimicrobiia bacterium]|nr:acetyl-CoA carboxylase biotin carboxylase subunit [Acidimicrobiia bacterium]